MKRIGLIYKKNFCRLIEEVFEYLKSQQTSIDGSSGWHQFLESGKIGNIATAQILMIYQMFNKEISGLNSCLNWFEKDKKTINWNGGTITGWSYLSSGPKVPCVEPTCRVYFTYQALAIQETKEVESDVYNFLKATKISSQNGIAWGFVPWGEAKILPTCIALCALSKIGDQNLIENTKKWLLAARDTQNAWGPTANSNATVTHTAHALLALREAGCEPKNPILNKAYEFLENKIKESLTNKEPNKNIDDNIGIMEIIDIPSYPPIESKPTRIQYFFNPLLLATRALLTNSKIDHKYAEAMAINVINDWGITRWKHPFLLNIQGITSWSVFDNLSVLKPFWQKWFGQEKHVLLYNIYSRGAITIRFGHIGSTILSIFKNNIIIFLLRQIFIFSGITVSFLLAIHIFGKSNLISSIIAGAFGVIGNILYGYLRKFGYFK